MASFTEIINTVLDVEGGYQNMPEDWGNYNAYDSNGELIPYKERPGVTLQAGTNRGISAALYSGLMKREVSVMEMKSISEDKAIMIYRKVYWEPIQADKINSQKLANLIFDARVNHGYTGIKIVQKVINTLGYSPQLQVDGIVGQKTIEAINSIAPHTLHNGILDGRIQLYHHLAISRPGNERFLNGWLNRLKKFPRMSEGGSGNNTAPPSSSSSGGGVGMVLFIAALITATAFID